MKNAILFLVTCCVLFNLSCGGGGNNGLLVNVIPNQPVGIPYGTTTVNGTAVTAPYFILNNVNLTWSGTGVIEVVTILISTPTTNAGVTNGVSVSCGIAGDQLTASYPNNITNGNVELSQTNNTAASTQIPCTMTLPTPIPSSINASVQVEVIGVLLDNTGNATGRITSTQNITIQ